MSLADVAAAVGGELVGPATPIVTGNVVIDSREVRPGDLFVALPGERVDGADFVDAALAAGAVAAVTARPGAGPVILVADPRVAFGDLAKAVLGRLPELKVIGITGSSGKTSTKDLLAQVLAVSGATVAPAESFNNEVGLPRTVLRADAGTRFLVLELGTRGGGQLTYLCRIAPPDIAVVLNVGSAHVGEFGSRAAIAAAKAELVSCVAPDGVVVLNGDDPLVRDMARMAPRGARIVTFGETAASDVQARNVRLDATARAEFDLVVGDESVGVRLLLAGEHQVANALAAAAVAVALGIDLRQVATSLCSATARSRWRMAVSQTPDGVTIVNDAYNANPESVRAALKSLAAMGHGRRTWAVLGEMRELGPEARDQHDAIGRFAARLGIDRLVVVGAAARPIYLAAAREVSWSGQAVLVDSVAAAGELLAGEVTSGDVVLVKASRAVGLEAVAEALERRSRP